MHRFPGPTKYPPLILKHGLTQIDGLWTWHQDVIQGKVRAAERHRSTCSIEQRIPVMWWDFVEAYPVKSPAPDFRADSGAVAFESIELTHRGLSRPTIGGLIAGVGAAIAGAVDIGF